MLYITKIKYLYKIHAILLIYVLGKKINVYRYTGEKYHAF